MALKKTRKVEDSFVSFFVNEFDFDVMETYERLKNIARVPVDKMRDKHVLSRYINTAARDAVDANVIARHAAEQRNLQKIDEMVLMKRLKNIAMKRIRDQLEADGITKKQITKDMIEEEIASGSDTGKLYRNMVEKREELRKIRDILNEFAKQWNQRVSSLQSQLKALNDREINFGS